MRSKYAHKRRHKTAYVDYAKNLYANRSVDL